MCCRRRHGRRRYQPLILALGFYAYRKFQQRKDKRAMLGSSDVAVPGVLEREANAEVLEKIALAPPPSYDVATGGVGPGRREKAIESGAGEDCGDVCEEEGLLVVGEEREGGERVGKEVEGV